MSGPSTPETVVAFWRDAGPSKWFSKDVDFDAAIREGFLATFEAAARGDLDDWAKTPDGALALILVLDQFPRNLFRDSPRAWESDGKALDVADAAIRKGFDWAIDTDLRRFVHMPFMHAEDMDAQWRCIDLCRASGDVEGVKYAAIHAEIIEKFGRFPHRNPILGRETTPEEQAYLDDGGFAG